MAMDSTFVLGQLAVSLDSPSMDSVNVKNFVSPSNATSSTPTTTPLTSLAASSTATATINNLWDLKASRNEIYPGERSFSSTIPTTSSIKSNSITNFSPTFKLTKSKPTSACHLLTGNINTIVKPILKSSSSLLTNHHSSTRHKRCSSLGHSIRYNDEPSQPFPSYLQEKQQNQPSTSSSPLACLTCPSTPNAYTNVPTAFSNITNMPFIMSSQPTSTMSTFSDQQQHLPPPSTPTSVTFNDYTDCDYCQQADHNVTISKQLATATDNTINNCQRCVSGSLAGVTFFDPSSSDSNNHHHHPSSSSSLTSHQYSQYALRHNPSNNQHSSLFQHANPGNQGRTLNNLDSNSSSLPPLASVESTIQCNSSDNPSSQAQPYHHSHHSHHHHHHNRSFKSHLNETADRQSLYSIHMEKDFRYFFQHPYARLLVAYSVIACNFLIFAEDPISHSHTECGLPIVGNVISFIFTKYPPEVPWKVVKVILWLTAVGVGMVTGKYLVHHVLLRRILRLKMFRDEEGTWMIMILITFICTYMFSLLYNILLLSAHPRPSPYLITTQMGVSNSSFMKAAACGTWLGDFFTAWVVTDMMLQDELYPGWAKGLRSFWTRHGHIRIFIFWTGSIGVSSLVIYMISSDEISWDNLNHNYVNTTELSRAFLASMILVMDLLVVMQDWDFPHFVCDMDIKLPGLKQASYSFKIFTIKKTLSLPETFVFHITGKWFNYGIIIVVMMLDLNMWKNQIIYYPPDFGQYTGPDKRVYTVADESILSTGNSSLWTYNVRASTIDPVTNRSFMEGDLVVNSRYLGYPIYVKSLAFLPCAAGCILFFTLIYQYGRFPPKTDASYGGRLKKRKSNSSWRRERRDSRHGYISWKGITTYEEEARTFRRQLQEENSNV